MSETNPRLVVERYLAEVLDGSNPASAPELIANAVVRQRVDSFRAAFPDARATTDQVLEQGDLVAVQLHGHGTHLGMCQGSPPTGRTWAAPCTAIYRVDAGQVAEAWVNRDWLAVMEQLGCIERVANVSA